MRRSSRLESATDRAIFRVNEYLADAFGTYVMGPAYACAAIRLRLNPSTASDDEAQPGLDPERAIIILAVLEKMNKANRFGEVIGNLNECWQQSMKVSRADRDPIWKTKRKKLDRLVDEIWELFKEDIDRYTPV